MDAYKSTIFLFRPEIPFLGKLGPQNQNRQSKLKFCIKTNMNMQNSMLTFTFSVLDMKYPFWLYLVQKNKVVGLN